jgi:S1-C subfamily serine protease
MLVRLLLALSVLPPTGATAFGQAIQPSDGQPTSSRSYSAPTPLTLGLSALQRAGAGPAQAMVPPNEIAPSGFTRTEVQMVQDALIWNGVYAGLKDGGWGRMTVEGVREWRRRNSLRASETFTMAELSMLFEGAVRARDAVGWTMERESETGLWFGYPSALLPTRKAVSRKVFDAEVSLESPDGSISIALRRWSAPSVVVIDFINEFANAYRSGGGSLTYRLDRPDRQVVSLEHRGFSIYTRFDRVGAEWRGFSIVAKQNEPLVRSLIPAMSAEFNPLGIPVVTGAAPILGVVLSGLVERGILRIEPGTNGPAQPPAPAQIAGTAPVAPPSPAGPVIKSSGTAFVVGRDGIMLTNQHVVDGCGSLTLQSGERLNVVASDRKADLAILQVSGRVFDKIVRFRRDQTIDLGESLMVFGFPHYRAVSTALNITNGIVSATVGVGNDPTNFQMNAALQPGNSGGPVIDAAGLAIGVAVARLNDVRIMATTGTVPQTMNYAVRGQIAEAFLLSNGIMVEKVRSDGTVDLREVARTMQEAVLPVLCYR